MATRPPATTSFSSWDFLNKHVQQELQGGEFVSAETTLVAAGPPRLTDTGVTGTTSSGGMVYPLGVLENVGISQSKQLQRIFEIGSRRSYFVPGRVVGSLTLGRVMYHGPSLLKALYAHWDGRRSLPQFMYNPVGNTITVDGVTTPDANAKLLELGDLQTQLHRVRFAPGYNDLWLSLFSDIFNQPFGLAVYIKDGLERTLGAVYLEECYLQGHQVSISSGSVLLMEGVSAQFDIARPIMMAAAG